MSSELTAYRYGKDKIRVFRVVREANIQHVVEYNVTSLLEGDVGTSYTAADNSVVVATDSSAYRRIFVWMGLTLSNDKSRTSRTVSCGVVQWTTTTDNG
jgi:urate oxidase